MGKIKTAIVLDPVGHGFGEVCGEDEVREVLLKYRVLVHPAQIDHYAPGSTCPGRITDGTELVLFDFGGVTYGQQDLALDQSAGLLRWAEDHPSSLVVILSTFTFEHYYAIAAQERGLGDGLLHNVVLEHGRGDDSSDSPFPEWFKAAHGIGDKNWGDVFDAEHADEIVAPDDPMDAMSEPWEES